MHPPAINDTRNSSLSYLALRQSLGVLGLALPVLVWIFNDFELKSSISHFYYSSASVLFTGFMFAFGIFLIFYPGRRDESDKISDNWVTTISGFGALLTALIPTAYDSDCLDPFVYSIELASFCDITALTTPYIHNNSMLGIIHLSCAALFLILMGYMSFARFTKGNTTGKMKRFYKFCAIMVWVPLAALGAKFAFDLPWSEYIVYICECISLGFFGMAWLVKGKTFKRFGFH
jgi:hypothetical protein